MNKAVSLEPKLQQMLELLSEGASTRAIAKRMGYSEGTVRVYLHNLYRKLGVRNRTAAILWHLGQAGEKPRAAPAEAPAAFPVDEGMSDESFGRAALRDGLLGSLGIMESFLGPNGRLWEAGLKLKGEAVDPELARRRAMARTLWRALLAGDFARGKALYDDGFTDEPGRASPSEALLLSIVLACGGYSTAADRVLKQLQPGRKASPGVSAREMQLAHAVQGAVERNDSEAMASLRRLASSSAAPAPLRQIAIAVLFHALRAFRDPDAASEVADLLWAEAESARRQLEAMGIRPLAMPRDAAAEESSRPTARERAAATR